MIDVPLIDELREARRRLAEACREDLQRYAKMLEEVSVRFPGAYVTQPLTPQAAPAKPAQETHI